MRHIITLPCTAQELEGALRRYCEANGAWQEPLAVAVYRNGEGRERYALEIGTDGRDGR